MIEVKTCYSTYKYINMANDGSSTNSMPMEAAEISKIEEYLETGEDSLLSAMVDISLTEPPSFDFSGLVCLIKDKETM